MLASKNRIFSPVCLWIFPSDYAKREREREKERERERERKKE